VNPCREKKSRPLRTPTPAERLDEAVERLLSDEPPAFDIELLPLVDTASRLHEALPLLPAGHSFEARLAARLAHPGGIGSMLATVGEATRRELKHPSRLLVTGAVSSAAVGVGVTAFAVWRGTRRHAGPRP
jgi:hypothetical protein